MRSVTHQLTYVGSHLVSLLPKKLKEKHQRIHDEAVQTTKGHEGAIGVPIQAMKTSGSICLDTLSFGAKALSVYRNSFDTLFL